MKLEFESKTEPEPEAGGELATRARSFLWSYAPSTLESVHVAGPGSLAFTLHPVAPPITLAVDAGRAIIEADTLAIGPGYDAHARDVVSALARELRVEPIDRGSEEGSSEERAFAFLAREAARATPETGPHFIGYVGRHRYPTVRLSTLLGPRDERWRARVAVDPAAGRDAFPWLRDGPEHLRGRALSLLWHAVRFREPISEAEEELAESALEDLRDAYREDPGLDYPAEAWDELSRLLGGRHRPPRSVFSRDARSAPPGIRGRIGYRRLTVEREVGAGFSIRFPGELAEEESEDGIWAGDLERRIHVAGVFADPDAPAAELVREAEPEGEAVPLSLAGLEARAAIAYAGDETSLTAVAATRGALCVLTAAERGGGSSFVHAVARSIAHRS